MPVGIVNNQQNEEDEQLADLGQPSQTERRKRPGREESIR